MPIMLPARALLAFGLMLFIAVASYTQPPEDPLKHLIKIGKREWVDVRAVRFYRAPLIYEDGTICYSCAALVTDGGPVGLTVEGIEDMNRLLRIPGQGVPQ